MSPRPLVVALVLVGVLCGATPAAAEITFNEGAPMTVSRLAPSQVTLPGGRILVAGGQGRDGHLLASAELYDPATNSWSATGSMATGRYRNTAVLLGDGKVLVTGGAGDAAGATAELYDPVTGAWTPTGSMAQSRYELALAVLPGGKVLAAGGGPGNGTGAELYDPVTGTWSPTGALAVARFEFAWAQLTDGSVVITSDRSAERYDPATGVWSSAGTPTGGGNHAMTLTRLADGRLLLAGGTDAGAFVGGEIGPPVHYASTSLYDPTANSWTAAAPLPSTVGGHLALARAGGDVFFAGGITDSRAPLRLAWRYDPAANTFTDLGEMNVGRAFATVAALPGNRLIVIGGRGELLPQGSTEVYPGVATASVPDVWFGSRPPGSAGRTIAIPVRNRGSVGLRVGGATVAGADAADFAVDAKDCLGRSVAEGDACLVLVTFTPGAAGPRTATLTLAGNVAATSATLTGAGDGPVPAGPPGAAGAPGDAGGGGSLGPAGPSGPTGSSGRGSRVTCKVPRAKRRLVRCQVKGALARRARLTRGGVVYARGTVRRLRAVRALGRGRYVLHLGATRIVVHVR